MAAGDFSPGGRDIREINQVHSANRREIVHVPANLPKERRRNWLAPFNTKIEIRIWAAVFARQRAEDEELDALLLIFAPQRFEPGNQPGRKKVKRSSIGHLCEYDSEIRRGNQRASCHESVWAGGTRSACHAEAQAGRVLFLDGTEAVPPATKLVARRSRGRHVTRSYL